MSYTFSIDQKYFFFGSFFLILPNTGKHKNYAKIYNSRRWKESD